MDITDKILVTDSDVKSVEQNGVGAAVVMEQKQALVSSNLHAPKVVHLLPMLVMKHDIINLKIHLVYKVFPTVTKILLFFEIKEY